MAKGIYQRYANAQKPEYNSGWRKYASKYEDIPRGRRIFSGYEILKIGTSFWFRGTGYIGTAIEVYNRGDRNIRYYNGGSYIGNVGEDTSNIIIRGFLDDYASTTVKSSFTLNGGSDYTYTPYISETLVDVRGAYLNDVIADYGSLPTDGRHTDGYWYTYLKPATNASVNVNGIFRDADLWGNVNGIFRPSQTSMNVNGVYRQ
ncbi:MAG: hypothetical protein WAX04_04605 [Oscillospiraceae bacterium]